MTDNEKAAIAAGLWEPFEVHVIKHHDRNQCPRCLSDVRNPWHKAPDMHDPANLWRALENCHLEAHWYAGPKCWRVYYEGRSLVGVKLGSLVDRVFASLVALYDAEHPE